MDQSTLALDILLTGDRLVLRILLIAVSVLWLLTGVYIFFAPQAFYDNTPGVKMMGPFNLHFIRDVALAFFASGMATGWGALRRERAIATAGVLWPAMHAVFHIQLWVGRGFVMDNVTASDFVVVVTPAAAAIWATWQLPAVEIRPSSLQDTVSHDG